MLIVAVAMFARRSGAGDAGVRRLNRENFPSSSAGLVTGSIFRFFGIGGGFLIVPGLIFAAGLPIINAVGSSLLVVTASGATAALNYAASGIHDRRLAAMLLAEGVVGGLVGGRVARTFSGMRGFLTYS